MISRRRIARAIAELLQDHQPAEVATAVAHYLQQHPRHINHELLMADVAEFVANSGVLNVEIATAHTLAADTLQKIETQLQKMTGASTIFIDHQVDQSLIGGLRVKGPGLIINNTVADQLQRLKD